MAQTEQQAADEATRILHPLNRVHRRVASVQLRVANATAELAHYEALEAEAKAELGGYKYKFNKATQMYEAK
jgi:hypothetical protein